MIPKLGYFLLSCLGFLSVSWAGQDFPLLSRDVRPYFYNLSIVAEPEKRNNTPLLAGQVDIRIVIDFPTTFIELHAAADMNIERAEIDGKPVSRIVRLRHERIQLHTPANITVLPRGKHLITIGYNVEESLAAKSNWGTPGFYHPKEIGSINGVNITHNYVWTQGEEYGARHYVPCFDDPDKKAKWKVKISHPPEYTALSNGKSLEKPFYGDLSTSLAVTEFEATPPMSSYLLTFAVSKHKRVTLLTKDGYQLSVYAINMTKAEEELVLLKECFEYLNSVLQPKYPLSKIDVFLRSPGGWAMENWGLITADYMLKHIMQHELAHQWFGNLVTTRTWSHYWLNEGFATWWENQREDTPVSFVTFLNQVLDGDIGDKAEPIVASGESEVGSTLVRYPKGGCLLHMLEGLVGRPKLIEIMNQYLLRHQYQSVETIQFFEEFVEHFEKNTDQEELKNLDIVDWGIQWTYQAGYPIIDVKEDDTGYILTQRPSTNKTDETGTPQKWDIPLFIRNPMLCSNKTTMPIRFFKKEKAEYRLEKAEVGSPLMLNNGYGMYRVNYGNSSRQILSTVQNPYGCISEDEKLVVLYDLKSGSDLAVAEKAGKMIEAGKPKGLPQESRKSRRY